MGFKIYSITFSNVADGETQEKVIQVNKNINFKYISFSSFSGNILFGIRVEDAELFSPDTIQTTHFNYGQGNLYEIPKPIVIESKKTISIKLKNISGSNLSSYTISLHGIEHGIEE